MKRLLPRRITGRRSSPWPVTPSQVRQPKIGGVLSELPSASSIGDTDTTLLPPSARHTTLHFD